MRNIVVSIAVAACAAACSGAPGSNGGGSGASSEEVLPAPPSIPTYERRPACAEEPGKMRCFSYQRANEQGEYAPYASPQSAHGLTPSDLHDAYNLPSSGGKGTLVAIVDAYDYTNAENDLATYRSQFGLPACTSQNGCFKKVNQQGHASPLPQQSQDWAGEISLDLDMVSAVCPDCTILLVEASTSNMDDFGQSVETAVKLGATVVSNSYGGAEDSSVTGGEKYFDHPGVAFFVASGDNGYTVNYPASSAHVIAVGGTSMVKSQNARGWSESAWNKGSSGCSRYIAKPAWQKDQGCQRRTVADISAVGDPNTGVVIYQHGWQVWGGTSASSPIVAAAFALLGKADKALGFAYANTGDWFDVTSGSNGQCGGTYLCTARPGYDGPTGWGTPNGTALAGGSPPPSDAGSPQPPPEDAGAPPPSCTQEQQDQGGGAGPQPLAGSVCGALQMPGETDAYSFTVAAGGSYDVRLQTTGDATLTLYKWAGSGWNPVPSTSPTEIAHTSSSGGQYIVVVGSPSNSTQSYVISLQ